MAWNTENKPFDLYSSDFDTETAEVICDGCSEVFDWSDKERGSGDEIPICSQVCYEKYYSEEEDERYCEAEQDCPYNSYVFGEKKMS